MKILDFPRFRLPLLIVACVQFLPLSALAQQVQPAADNTVTNYPIDVSPTLNRVLTRLVLENMPHTYSNEKKWGMQKKRWDGLKWRVEGFKVETKRRFKMVNHGTWKKYSAQLVDPRNQFGVSVKNIHKTANDKIAFDVHFTTRMLLHARQSEWVKGVQMYSISADGKAKVRLKVSMEMGIELIPGGFPPDLQLRPTATAADLIVDDFRIDRISKLGGEFAKQVTRAARKELDGEIVEKETELVQKINRELAKKSDQLKISLSDALQLEWADQARPFLPAGLQPVIQAMETEHKTK